MYNYGNELIIGIIEDISALSGKTGGTYNSFTSSGKTVIRFVDYSIDYDMVLYTIETNVKADVPEGIYSYLVQADFFDYNEDEVEYTADFGNLYISHNEAEWQYDSEYHWCLCTVDGCIQHTVANPLKKAEHSYSNGVLTKNDDTGEYFVIYTCSICGYSYTVENLESFVQDDVLPEQALNESLIYGKMPTVFEIYDNGDYFSLSGADCLTDGNTEINCDMIYSDKGLFIGSDNRLRNDDGNEVYVDILYEVAEVDSMAEISSVWLKNADKELSTYSYEIYASASRVGLGESDTLVATVCNKNAAKNQLVSFPNSVKGRYLLLRITMGVQANTANYTDSYARLAELCVFGSTQTLASEVKHNKNSTNSLTDSLIYYDPTIDPPINPLKASVIDDGKEYSLKSGDMRYAHDGNTNLNINYVYNNFYGRFVNGYGYRNTHTKPEVYVDIIYTIPNKYRDYLMDEIYIELTGDSGSVLNANRYELYLSDSLKNITAPEALVASVVNNNAAGSQLIEISGKRKGTFLLCRVTAGIQENFAENASYGYDSSYLRISEIALFGHQDEVITDINCDGEFDIRDLVREKKIILGIEPENRASDFDGDGKARASDLIEIRRWLLNCYIDNTVDKEYVSDIETSDYTAPIASSGTADADMVRNIDISLNNTVFTGYMGLGTNIFAGTLSDEGKLYTGFNEVYFELEKKRINTLSPNTARFLFPIDWIITDIEGSPRRSDWQNNKDYINYKNGIYDFESDEMYSAIKYLEALKEAGTQVEINLGWKVSPRIENWFSAPSLADAEAQAPRDIAAFSNACAALLDELINTRGFDNIKYLSFYNEPNAPYEFTVIGDKQAYYAAVIKGAYSAMEKYGLNRKVEIWGCEVATQFADVMQSWIDKTNRTAQSTVSGYSMHSYYATSSHAGVLDYNKFFDTYTKLYGYLKDRNIQNKRIMVTEYLPSVAEEGQEQWNFSDAAQLIATANTGMRGIMNWELFGGYATYPVGLTGGYFHDSRCWKSVSKYGVDTVKSFFNEASLYTNYIGAESDVLHTEWTGEDIRTAAFKRSDGEYTFVIEANTADIRTVNLNFDRVLGKTVYKYKCTPNDTADENALIPQSVDCFKNVGRNLTDCIDAEYAVYIYTTAVPVSQIKLTNGVFYSCNAGDSVKLECELIDCNQNDSLVYEITASTGAEKGYISSDGVYTASEAATEGQMVSVKISTENNSDIYTVALIEIV